MTAVPLHDRLSAPELPTLDHPSIARWRPATAADLGLITPFVQAIAELEMPGIPQPDWYVSARFEFPDFDPQTDSLLGFDTDGELAAVAFVDALQSREIRYHLSVHGYVRPDLRRRGIGTQLLAWQRARAEQILAASPLALPGWIDLDVNGDQPGQIALAEAGGFPVRRYFTEMSRELSGDIPSIKIAADVAVVPPSPELTEPGRLAYNDAFRDHWGFSPAVPERWARNAAKGLHDPRVSRLAVAPDGTVAGFVYAHLTDDLSAGYIGLVGVRRDFRRQGVAPALIAAVLRAHRELGVPRTALDVDSDSPTSADSLYTGLGFVPVGSSIATVREY